PDVQCASIPTRCLSLHPHIHISTKESREPAPAYIPDIPVNTVREFTTFVHNTNFGDVFGLNIDELGGEATGRCHLMGRLKMQFGPRFGDSGGSALHLLPTGACLAVSPVPLAPLPA